MPHSDQDADPIAIARIGRPVGLAGKCNIMPVGETLAQLKLPARVLVNLGNRSLTCVTITSLHRTPKGYQAFFEGYADRDGIAVLRNRTVFIRENELPRLEDDAWYSFQLEGLIVMSRSGPIGRVTAVQNYPTVDALEVKRDDGRQILIPLTRDTVGKVDEEAGTIEIFTDALEDVL